MSTEEISEGNKLIANFRGKSSESQKYMLKYHYDWNWLMPVVEQINSICVKNGEELSNHSRAQEHLSNQLDNPLHWKSWSYHYIKLSTDINNVYKQVVEFIKWYNEHKNGK